MHAALTNTAPLHPEAPTAPGAGASRDSIDNLRLEIKALKEQLRHAQKLACLGTTSAMLAHEYNNVFAPLISYAQYALDKHDVELMRKALRTVLKQYSTVQAMSDRILSIARPKTASVEGVNLRQLLHEAIDCLGRDLSKDNISVSIQADDSTQIEADRDALLQVFFNLILNARQAVLGRRGVIKITATPLPGARVMIHFRDSGSGINPENLERIFQPFFSTKQNEDRREQRGIGLGLAICRDIIEEHGGSIDVESIPDHGTTFTITLPSVSGSVS